MRYAYLMPLLDAMAYGDVSVKHFENDEYTRTYKGPASLVKKDMVNDYDKGYLVDDPYEMIVWFCEVKDGLLYVEC